MNPSPAADLSHLTGEARVLAAIAEVRDLPASAPVVLQALACLDNPDYTLVDVQRVLLCDQALVARILRLANSAYFGFRNEVRTIAQAMVLLGVNRIRTLLQRFWRIACWDS